MQLKPGIHHIAIKVQDLSQAKKFYQRILKLSVMATWIHPSGELRSVWLACGNVILMLEHTSQHTTVSHALSNPLLGLHLVAFPIDKQDRDLWKQHLLQNGIFITGESKYSLYFEDPEHNRLALSHFPN